MNLNYGYDKKALIILTQSADKSLDEHNIVIDYDGEVIIDPEHYFPNVPVNRYKFAARITDQSLRDSVTTAGLYDALEAIYESYNRKQDGNIAGHNHLKIAA